VDTTQAPVLGQMIDAVQTGDRAALEGVFAEDVWLRASLPHGDVQRFSRVEAAALILGWFGGLPGIAREHEVVDLVGDVWHVGYRFTWCEAETDRVVEQHAYCTLAAGLITSMRVVCSGFQTIGAGDAEAVVADARLDALGDGCATLTPRIATAMRAIQPGQVLTVLSDDPAAPDSVAAWSRMTGHEIVGTDTGPDGTRFFLRHR
jgi:tRNA 2-thiouridine synthesizing protein A